MRFPKNQDPIMLKHVLRTASSEAPPESRARLLDFMISTAAMDGVAIALAPARPDQPQAPAGANSTFAGTQGIQYANLMFLACRRGPTRRKRIHLARIDGFSLLRAVVDDMDSSHNATPLCGTTIAWRGLAIAEMPNLVINMPSARDPGKFHRDILDAFERTPDTCHHCALALAKIIPVGDEDARQKSRAKAIR